MIAIANIPGVVVQEEIGRGRFGVVFRARRGELDCVVKVAHRTPELLQSPELFQRFRREAIGLARVRHPAVPKVLEIGEADGLPFVAMEHVAGESLAQRLALGPLALEQVVDLAAQLSSALAAFHSRGLVHRDVKPNNIILDAATRHVRLVDYGFSTFTAVGATNEDREHYIAPERLAEAMPRIDTRVDLYALGVVLFECLCGRPPQRHDAVDAQLREAGIAANNALGGILERLLQAEPDARPESATELLDALARRGRLPAPQGRTPNRRTKRDGRRGTSTDQPPLVERSEALERFSQLWELAQQTRSPRAVFVRGAMGSGKTRLLHAAVDSLPSTDAMWLWSTCQRGDPRPFAAVQKLIDSFFSWLDGLSAEAQQAHRLRVQQAARASLAPFVRVLSPRLLEFCGVNALPPSPNESQHVILSGVAAFLAAWWRNLAPVAIVVDDLQWLDSASAAVLRRALDELDEAAALFALSYREADGVGPPAAVSELIGAKTFAEIVLQPLSKAATAEMIRAHLGADEVDDGLVEYVHKLSAGAPLGVLELMRMFLDAGVLLPRWGRWQQNSAELEQLRLPRGIKELIKRRLDGVSANCECGLAAAAVMGGHVHADLVATACGLDGNQTHAFLWEARELGLVEPDAHGRLRFAHESIREVVLGSLSAKRLQSLHQCIAESLDYAGPEDVASWYALARHYAHGDWRQTPERVYETNLRAGEMAFASFDNANAHVFLETTEACARRMGLSLSSAFRKMLGETHLRRGALEESLSQFELSLEACSEAIARGDILCRISRVHELAGRPQRAWQALRRGFAMVGASIPAPTFVSFARALLFWGKTWLQRLLRGFASPPAEGRARLETLAFLYHHAMRQSVESSDLLTALQSAVYGLCIGMRLGPSEPRCKAYATYGLFLALLGVPKRGQRWLEAAKAEARSLLSPESRAFALRLQHIALATRGRFEASLEVGRQAVQDYGPWQDVSEYCQLCSSFHIIESLRGRPTEAWRWAKMAYAKAQLSTGAPVPFGLIQHSAAAAAAAVGREQQAQSIVAAVGPQSQTPENGHLALASIVEQVHRHVASGNLEREFENLVEEFVQRNPKPRASHPGLASFYVHLAHARVHQCLRDTGPAADALEKLQVARRMLCQAPKMPGAYVHRPLIRAYECLLKRRYQRAERLFARAEAMASQNNFPGVLYAVARGRAHAWRFRGRETRARSQARLAAAIASESGSPNRLRWVCEEFALDPERFPLAPVASESPAAASMSGRSVPRKRELGALHQLIKATGRELQADVLARTALDELIDILAAERGVLFMHAQDGSGLAPVAARDAYLNDIHDLSLARRLAKRVKDAGKPLMLDGRERCEDQSRPDPEQRLTPGSTIAAPLVFHDVMLGTVHLERARGRGFAHEDLEVLQTLSHQLATALELAHALRQQVEAREALQRSEGRYRRFVEAAYDPIFIFDADTARVLEVNNKGMQLLDKPKRQIQQTLHSELYAGEARAKAEAFFQQALARSEYLTHRLLLVDAAGREIPVEAAARVLEIEQGRVIEVVYRDLRERERLEAELRQAQKAEAVGQLAGGLAHDFNNALTVLDTSIGLAREHCTEAGERELDEARRTIRHASELTNKLMTLSQQDVVAPQVVSLNDVVGSIVEMVGRMLGSNNELRTELAPELPPVKVDVSQVEQLLLNLAANARDAMPQGGVLTIQTKARELTLDTPGAPAQAEPGRYVVLKVSDTGEGIPAEIQERIFEPFFTQKPQGQGTGLGLAMVQGTVKQAGGFIQVSSQPQQGTAFKIYLPASPETAANAGDAAAADARKSSTDTATTAVADNPAESAHELTAATAQPRGDKVLLVDDSGPMRRTIARTLKLYGYQCITAGPESAVEQFSAHSGEIGLVICDVLMPVVSGPQLVAQLKQSKPDLSVLYISGYSDGHLLEAGTLQPGVDLMQKPFDMEELATKVGHLLRGGDAGTGGVRD